MKQKVSISLLSIALLIMLSIITSSCNNSSKQGIDNRKHKEYTLPKLVREYFHNHPNAYNNEITRNRAAKDLQEIVLQNSSSLFELPFMYNKTYVHNGSNQYIVELCTHLGSYLGSSTWLIIYAKCTEEVALSLVDKGYYYIKGNFRGKITEQSPKSNPVLYAIENVFYADVADALYMKKTDIFSLGAFYIEDLSVKPASSLDFNYYY
jgi:hypothetical protein